MEDSVKLFGSAAIVSMATLPLTFPLFASGFGDVAAGGRNAQTARARSAKYGYVDF